DYTFGESLHYPDHSIIQTIDGGFAVVGLEFKKNLPVLTSSFIKLDRSGNLEWQKLLISGFDLLVQNSDGSFTVAGTVEPNGSPRDFGVLKLKPTIIPDKQPPTAAFTASPTQGKAPLLVNVDSSESFDSDGTIVKYEWFVNDTYIGNYADSNSPSGLDFDASLKRAPGVYTITLKVTDNDGLTDEAQRAIHILPDTPLPSTETHTLILTNRMKFAQLYGSTQADQLMSKLNELAKHPDVQGLVIQVEDDSMVANAYAIRGDKYDNKNQANVVVVSIKQLIRRHWDALGNQLENIMLIGDDRVIPFYRIADGTFEPDPWTLTDDFYTDRNPTECPTCANPLVFIPDIAGGRLIETPAQIIGMIDAFLADNNLNIRSAAITGYDFVQDGAKAACDTLQRVDIPSDCSLMGEFWGSEDFKGQILNRPHDITSINGHAYYEMFLTPDDKHIWASDFANSSTDFAGTLFYTVGCHSGLNVTDKLDLPESLAIKQANYIANTGYGIGGLNGIELSEELMWNLTKELVKSQTTLGKALLNAKQQYFADNPNFGPFDEKIVAESTLYGLPMYQVTSSATAKLSPAITAIQTQTTEEQGLQKAGYSYTWATATPITATTSGKKFYSLNGTMTSSSEGKPILPKLSYNVTQTQKALHGVVFRGGSYNTVNVTPPIQRFKTTTGHITPERTFSAPGWYPSIFFTPNTVPLDVEAKETLVATAGQYNPNLTTGQQRIFSNMDFDVFHHVNTNDWTKPTVYLMENRLNANIATVTIATSDASGIKEVVLAYTDGNGTWNSTNLTGSDVTWTGSFAANANTEFFIQAIDKAGNVAVNENEGKYFKVGQTPINLTTARLTAHLINISTRAAILGGANDVIAGFIITGSGAQKVIIRALSLEAGVDPKLTVHQYPSGELLASNDNWQTDPRV
ncbi:MAG: PKD domain-containing protein, partial [Candidatus Parabeggiatoa sp.]|nr:PKD domain-containing protein [Candidatus Parabeggiatoa sp.]